VSPPTLAVLELIVSEMGLEHVDPPFDMISSIVTTNLPPEPPPPPRTSGDPRRLR